MFWPKKKDKTGANKNNLNQLGQGLILFDTVEEAIQAEKLVKKAGYNSWDFNKAQELIALGREATLAKLEELKEVKQKFSPQV